MRPASLVRKLAAFRRHTRANTIMMFAFALLPIMIAMGASIDFVRAYNARTKMQADLDVALLAAVKKISNDDASQLKALIQTWFSTQTSLDSYSLASISVDTSNATITATATANVATTFAKILNMDQIPLTVSSAVAGPTTSYLNVYLLLDKSASMMLAATTSGQTTMRQNISCEFACHTGDAHTVNNVSYTTNYQYGVAKSIQFRSDVLTDAVDAVLDEVDTADPGHTRIKVGLYRLSTDTTTVLSPTTSTSTVRSTLTSSSSGLTSTSSTDGTYFNTALKSMATIVGSNGTGKSSSSPLKLVMMITDGVQSQRAWVTTTSWSCKGYTTYNGVTYCTSYPMSTASKQVAPLNPSWCDYVKDNGPAMAVLYTQYLPVTLDWGYNGTLGSTMASSSWTSTWGGTLHSGVSSSTTRVNYLPIALQDCASSSNYYLSANSTSEITAGLATLFKQYLSTVRLTQ